MTWACRSAPRLCLRKSTVLNTYQLIDNVTWTKGRHTLKFGAEGRKYISSIRLTGNRARRLRILQPPALPAWTKAPTCSTSAPAMPDRSPETPSARLSSSTINTGCARTSPSTLGLRYDYQGISAGDKLQTLNAIASVPGLISFQAPTPQLDGFAPRVGLAYSPGTQRTHFHPRRIRLELRQVV